MNFWNALNKTLADGQSTDVTSGLFAGTYTRRGEAGVLDEPSTSERRRKRLLLTNFVKPWLADRLVIRGDYHASIFIVS